MTEDEARRITLLRAFEAPMAAPWTEADAAAASAEAARAVGEQAAPGRYLAARAQAGLALLLPKEPAAARLLQASRGARWPGPLLVVLAAGLGLATQALGPTQQLNLLAPPLLGLLGWNLLVYLALAVAALNRLARRKRAVHGASSAGTLASAEDLPGHVAAPPPFGLRRLLAAPAWRAAAGHPALRRFAERWSAQAAPLWSARAAVWLHAAAAALVAGVLASMYLHGLAFEYRAGWDSTFLSADAVHRLLNGVLGPASALSGIPLPSAAELAGLRFSAGPGENAARWIHLHALTAAGVVLLPRLVLALGAAIRVHRLAGHFPLPIDDAYSQRLLRSHRGGAVLLRVQPVQYRLPAVAIDGLQRVLRHSFGEQARLQLAEPLHEGDDAGHGAPPAMLLFALSATPERETHGAAAEAWPAARLLVDTSGFAQRFGAARAQQRREAWQRMLAGLGRTPVFIDLAHPDLAAAEAALQAVPA
ncbi:MAG: DUF2868 domain-containing protein [Aquincola tertiaricarbonis]